jgi:hypothetical protein
VGRPGWRVTLPTTVLPPRLSERKGVRVVEERGRQSSTKVELLTVDYHLVGHAATGGRRFSNWLNLGDAPTIALDDVTLRSLHGARMSDVPLEYVLVNREAIMAAIPREEPAPAQGGEGDQKPLEYVDKERHAVVISLPPFAVGGGMHVAKGADLYRALITYAGSFMPITAARIVYTPNPELVWQGSVILANRDKAQLFWPAPEGWG